jgi:hypothetical protein
VVEQEQTADDWSVKINSAEDAFAEALPRNHFFPN